MAELPGVHNPKIDGTRAAFDVDTARLDDIVQFLATRGVRSLVSQPPTLEELFLRHYRMDVPAEDEPQPGSSEATK